jgi:Icc-related predicted phosphoesterase
MVLDEEIYAQEDSARRKRFQIDGPEYMEKSTRDELRQGLRAVCHYLENELVEINGLHIWGSPTTPWISKRAAMGFQYPPANLERMWDIPDGIDILVTHGPPRGFGDRTFFGLLAGCPYLLQKAERVKPQFHFFGHIHEGGRLSQNENTVFVNAATCNLRYRPVQEIGYFYIKPKWKLGSSAEKIKKWKDETA